MCVILIADDKRPTAEMIEKAYNHNDHGAGIAWREPAEDGEGFEVVWKKGLNLEELQEIAANVPLPMVIHCRIASCGGKKKELTHPFPISEEVETALEGRTKGEVLFHNGHWNKWKETALEIAKGFSVQVPDGKLSDTRIMAWAAYHYGKNFIELIDEKGVAFGANDTTLFWGAGWHIIDDVWCSNTHFNTGFRRTGNNPTGAYNTGYHGVCKFGSCRNHNTDVSGYCPEHRPEVPEIGASRPQLPPSSTTSTPVAKVETKTESVIGNTTEPGGAQSDTPFAKWEAAQRAFRMGNLSKKGLKRARRAFEAISRTRAGMMPSTPRVVLKGELVLPGVH